MNCAEILKAMDDFYDEELQPRKKEEIARHVQECPNCKQDFGKHEILFKEVANLPSEIAPGNDLWQNISKSITDRGALRDLKSKPKESVKLADYDSKNKTKANKSLRIVGWSVAASVIILILTLGFWFFMPAVRSSWDVATIAGTPRVGAEIIDKTGRLAVGEWLETDGQSKVKLNVAKIGEILIEPNSLLRLISSTWLEQRIALDRGKIHARIWAPPRLFFVETPSATAIDLGCAYTLSVDPSGASILQVTSGRVALELGDRKALVPAGASCITKPGIGPGTPYFEDASDKFKQALTKIDFGQLDSAALDTLLNEARIFDTLTLWHLAFRVNDFDHNKIFRKIANLVPPPAIINQTDLVQLNQQELELWKNELEEYWFREDIPFWKEIWRGFFD